MKIFYLKNKKGFTLVEMMVAIAVFSVVMVTAMSALLNVIDANNKARSIKTAVNNVSFALESISKDMRMGTHYACGVSLPDVGLGDGCNVGGGKYVGYRSQRADKVSPADANSERKFAYYKFDNINGTGQIFECLEKSPKVTGVCSEADFQPITSTEVEITDVVFYVLGSGDTSRLSFGDPQKTQPRVVITVSGKAGSKVKTRTEFDLMTTISQIKRVKI
jgi:prepilin-type N-terminal cleavage/methylation domain-containing protein